ncbi:MAG: hypothetical protein ACYC96_12180 [Fimbriimonadaceae bacterium]
MPKPTDDPTPVGRVDRWKKLWGTPKRLDVDATAVAFDEFADAFVPSHMHKKFLKTFGVPKAHFGNRFFVEDVAFRNWDTKLAALLPPDATHVEATVLYGSPDALAGHRLKGEARRSLKDLVVDDWHAACAIVRAGGTSVYMFVEPKMRGCAVRTIRGIDEDNGGAE